MQRYSLAGPDGERDKFVERGLDLSGARYVVVRAEPETKAEFSQTTRLDITVRKVETISPHDILFSLPSLCGAALPPALTTPPEGEILVLHEDDWRQCELIAMQHAQLITQELAAIHGIHENEKVGVGFRNLHVRNAIATPLPPGIEWTTVVAHLGECTPLPGVAFRDHAPASANAARLDGGVVVWGTLGTEGLSTLCVHDLPNATPTSAAALRRIADAFSLVVVDWCPCRAYAPGNASLDGADELACM